MAERQFSLAAVAFALGLDEGRMRANVLFKAVLAIGFVGASMLTAVATESRCNKARHLAGLEKPLPNLHDRIMTGEPVRIVAIGSSSTEGTPADKQNEIYPAVLARMLSREILTPVEVINKGKGGETIPLMVQRLERDVVGVQPDLVVWQLGVNDVLQMDGIETAVSDMRAALQRLRALNLPVVLVDLQVSPLVDGDRDTPRMQAAIAEAARAEGVMQFNRYDIMKSLVVSREVDLSELVQADGLHMTPLAHLCTGTLLAKQIAGASMLMGSRAQSAANVSQQSGR
jgi:acyl-CoA thioesterase I